MMRHLEETKYPQNQNESRKAIV